MHGFGDAIASAILGMIFAAFAAGGLFVLFCVYAVPWLWGMIKPILHTLTG